MTNQPPLAPFSHSLHSCPLPFCLSFPATSRPFSNLSQNSCFFSLLLDSEFHSSMLLYQLDTWEIFCVSCVAQEHHTSLPQTPYKIFTIFFSCTFFGRWNHWWAHTLTKILSLLRNFFLLTFYIHIVFPNFFIVPATVNCHLVFIQCHTFLITLGSWHLLSRYCILFMLYNILAYFCANCHKIFSHRLFYSIPHNFTPFPPPFSLPSPRNLFPIRQELNVPKLSWDSKDSQTWEAATGILCVTDNPRTVIPSGGGNSFLLLYLFRDF